MNQEKEKKEEKKSRSRELFYIHVSDMVSILETWKELIEHFNNGTLDAEMIKKMDNKLADIVQFTKRTAKPVKF